MATVLMESDSFAVLAMRAGMLMRRKRDGKELYVQPGADTAALRREIDNIDDLPRRLRLQIFDSYVGEYFAA